jgi:predicted nucleotidyltransferase
VNKNDLYVLVEVVGGSRLYGTHRSDSDYDYRGVCLAPIPALIGLDPTFEQVEQHDPVDRVTMELRKFLGLALGNNPNILDTLFAPKDQWVKATDDWLTIWNLRHDVLSQKVRKSYVGYAMSQLKRIEGHARWLQNPPEQPDANDFGDYDGQQHWRWYGELEQKNYADLKKEWENYQAWFKGRNPVRHALEVKHGYDTKHAGHLFRLIIQAQNILRDMDFNPVLEGIDLEHVQAVMRGDLSYAQLITMANNAFTLVDTMPSNLPKEPDRSKLNRAVQGVYADYLHANFIH